MKKEDLLLYAVTDRSWLNGETLYEQVEKALKGGVTFLQLREKGLDEDAFLKEAKEMKKLCSRYRVPLIINDNVKIALESDADGVHVGQEDMEAGKVRKELGPDKIIGVSAHNAGEAILAFKQGADYLGAGAVFGSSTKKNTRNLSYETLQEICRSVDLPVVAIGGIGEENIPKLAGSGICGVAVVSALFAQKDIQKAAGRLKSRVTDMLKAENLQQQL